MEGVCALRYPRAHGTRRETERRTSAQVLGTRVLWGEAGVGRHPPPRAEEGSAVLVAHAEGCPCCEWRGA
ncbi:hypothetical protein I7I50_08708 [Histoplasma capsulatum G186AR]|uniref:Uncharacterized protein n=1 Tax=Ajellomyces capsulatus TaxID=5037 RepID=A0A8H8D0W4_AJECA|nr:hypothetical protein I7I52_06222 [Histoplasma capsulatum]QSS73800.1 hypothetical protein I7I50_08708 [Histoplasma capsulatum G186AR]